MDMSGIISKMLLLMLTIGIGFIANKCGAMNGEFSSRLSKFLLNVTVPGALLSAGVNGDIALSPAELLKLFALAAGLFVLLLAVAYAVPPVIRAKADEKGTYRFLMAFSNTIFMGYPVATAFFGASSVFYIAVLSLPLNIAVFTIGPKMITDGKSGSMNWKSLLSPATIAAVLSLLIIAFGIKAPPVIGELCSSVGAATSPIALMIIGSNLADTPFREIFGDRRMYLFSIFRLIVQPVICHFIFGIFVSDPVLLGCMTILAGLPSASMATLVSAQYGGNEKLASRGVMMSTLLSVVTIPLVMYLL